METIITILTFEVLKSVHRNTFFIFHRISVTCKDYTYCRIILKLKIYLIQSSVYTGFHHFDDIVLHTRKNNLRFRIAKTGIIFQNLRTIRCKHKTKENDSLKWASFCSHCVHCRLIYIFPAEFIYLFCVERTRGESSHSARIQSLITVLSAFMILCGCHCTDSFSIYK